MRGWIRAALVLACMGATAPLAALQTGDLPPTTTALLTTYADGHFRRELVSARPAWSWTPSFPRLPSSTPPSSVLPIRALKVARQLVGQDVRVTVSLLRFTPYEEQTVTTVTVSRGAHVVVRELEAFGVAPIDLSLVDAVPATPFLPSGLSVTPEVEISRVDLLSAPYPGYRVTVRNLSTKPIATFGVHARGAADLSMSMIRAGTDGRPAMNPGGSYTFDVNLTSGGRGENGPWSPTLLDVIEIDSVLWDDGSVAGTLHNAAAWMIPVDAGRRLQLVRAVDVLRQALTASTTETMLATIESGFGGLPSDDTTRLLAARQSMGETRATMLSDLRQFERNTDPHDAAAVSQWIQSTIARYESWIKRLSPL